MRQVGVIWIAWERHRRTESLSQELGAQLFAFSSCASRIVRHGLFLARTIAVLARTRPTVLIVQNPSWILTLVAIISKRLWGYKLVVDAHNAGVYPFAESHNRFRWIFPLFHRWADVTIVTNSLLGEVVRGNGGRVFVLPDPLPSWEIARVNTTSRRDRIHVAFICTYSSDEPYREVIEAARSLPDSYVIFVTGDVKRCDNEVRRHASGRIRFTGFLPDTDYRRLLSDSDMIMDLTTFPDCLVCGSYEAIALGVPLILSDTPVNRRLFRRGTVFTRNEAPAIAEAIQVAAGDLSRLREEVIELKREYCEEWQEQAERLRVAIGNL